MFNKYQVSSFSAPVGKGKCAALKGKSQTTPHGDYTEGVIDRQGLAERQVISL